MLREIPNTAQVAGEPRRAWFFCHDLDLVVWFDATDEPCGFQLAYDKYRGEHSIEWNRDTGFRHYRVDDGQAARLRRTHLVMKAENFSLPAYFERIGYTGEARADLATVAELMQRQLFTVPFENLDVQAGRIVSLEPADIVDKIVGRGRGGYCYEVNGLFAMALEALGVPWRFAGARPMTYPARRPKTHIVIIATLDGEDWLIDLGFGSYGMRAPMRLNELDVDVRQGFDTFRLSKPGEHEFMLQALVDGQWASQFSFDLWPAEWIDFMPANFVNSTHPEALFVKTLVVVLFDAEGRSMLVGNTLKTVTRGVMQQRTLLPVDRNIILADWFGLEPEA